MIDLETLSTTATAAVSQLGYALFDPDLDGIGPTGCFHLDIDAQIKNGLTVEWDTISWWMNQSAEAREKMTSPLLNRVLPSAVLNFLSDLFLNTTITGVWSHGSTFDLVIIENLFRKAQRKAPWSHKIIRDTRTLFWLAGPSLVWAKNEVLHSAEHDAIAQALTVQRAVKLIKEKAQCSLSTPETSITPSQPVSTSSGSAA
jgi:hypothetical protein